MDKPLVSIIIPLYNSEKYIAETIASVLDQTWPNKELVIVDDGSTDRSLSVAKGFESGNVKVFHQENMGAGAARNRGLQEAKGDFIQFLDADDLLSPDKISEQVELLQQNPDKLAFCDTAHFYDGSVHTNEYIIDQKQGFKYDDNPVNFFIGLLGGYGKQPAMIAVHAWLTPKHIIEKAGRWNEELTADDDGEYFCRVILSSKGVVKTNGYSYYRKYNNNNKSLSSPHSKEALESIFKSILLKKYHLSERDHLDAGHRAIHKQLTTLAVMCYSGHPQLYKLVMDELKNYPNYHFTPVLGGKAINFFAKIFGWENAMKFKSIT